MATKRLYLVEDNESMSLVRAVSQAQALSHVVGSKYKVRAATPDDVADYMSQGGEVEEAGATADAGEATE